MSNNNKIDFNILENADKETVDMISDKYQLVSDNDKKKMLAMSRNKYNKLVDEDDNSADNNSDSDVIKGVEIYSRPKWYKPAKIAAAAAAVLIVFTSSRLLLSSVSPPSTNSGSENVTEITTDIQPSTAETTDSLNSFSGSWSEEKCISAAEKLMELYIPLYNISAANGSYDPDDFITTYTYWGTADDLAVSDVDFEPYISGSAVYSPLYYYKVSDEKFQSVGDLKKYVLSFMSGQSLDELYASIADINDLPEEKYVLFNEGHDIPRFIIQDGDLYTQLLPFNYLDTSQWDSYVTQVFPENDTRYVAEKIYFNADINKFFIINIRVNHDQNDNYTIELDRWHETDLNMLDSYLNNNRPDLIELLYSQADTQEILSGESESEYTPVFTSDSDRKLLIDLMYNSIDSFDTAGGTIYRKSPNSDNIEKITFACNVPESLSYETIMDMSLTSGTSIDLINSGEADLTPADENEYRQYYKCDGSSVLISDSNSSEYSYCYDAVKREGYNNSFDPYAPVIREKACNLTSADIVVQPGEFLSGLIRMDNTDQWQIECILEFAGRECYEVTGYEPADGLTFRMLVDTKTGFMLEMELYNSDSQLIDFVRTQYISIDDGDYDYLKSIANSES